MIILEKKRLKRTKMIGCKLSATIMKVGGVGLGLGVVIMGSRFKSVNCKNVTVKLARFPLSRCPKKHLGFLFLSFQRIKH